MFSVITLEFAKNYAHIQPLTGSARHILIGCLVLGVGLVMIIAVRLLKAIFEEEL